MKNTKRKGFTIVELVIVIAVIAILAAVLIPTFASLVKKANVSADEQAVKQMNTALKIYEAENGKPTTIGEVKSALDKNLINAESLIPVTQQYAFYWNPEKNEVVLVGVDGKITKPETGWLLLSTTGYGDTVSLTASNISDIKDKMIKSTNANPLIVTLTEDVSFSGPESYVNMNNETEIGSVIIGNNACVVLDLNGKIFTIENRIILGGGSLTVKNSGSKDGGIIANDRVILNNKGSLTLSNVTVNVTEKSTSSSAVSINGISDTSITNCKIITEKGYGIGTNSLKSENDGARISIVDSYIETKHGDNTDKNSSPNYAGINITISADVTIDGCTVKGASSGAYLRGCNATIRNSTFEHFVTNHEDGGTAWSSGCHGRFADLVLACGGETVYTGHLATANYVCENVTATEVVVHNPKGEGKINVSGIDNYHKCIKSSDQLCGGTDEACQ